METPRLIAVPVTASLLAPVEVRLVQQNDNALASWNRRVRLFNRGRLR